MKRRNPQLLLRLDAAAPDASERWREGASLAYLGTLLSLRLGGGCKEALQHGEDLHLPLPPEATPRQIQDAAESWLRARALQRLGDEAAGAARRLGRAVPAITLSFASRAGWVQADGRGGLRCHWRLIEQPPAVIGQVMASAVRSLPAEAASLDLFALA